MRVVLITMANVCPFVSSYQASCTGYYSEEDHCPLPPGCLFGPHYEGCINLSVQHCPHVPRRSYPVLGAWEWRESCERAKAATCLPSWARHLN